MILIDTLHINDFGGKILLDYLIDRLNKTNLDVKYLFDSRYLLPPKINGSFDILKASLSNRLKYYIKNKNNFDKVFCLGNIPPPVKLNIPVYTYFHYGPLLQGSNYKNISSFKNLLKNIIIKYYSKNSNYFIVQTNLNKDIINKKYNYNKENILVIPFYDDNRIYFTNVTKIDKFLYISNSNAHKNHINLLKAWIILSKLGYYPELVLTIPYDDMVLINFIEKIKKDYSLKIKNIQTYDNLIINKLYNETKYFIFPSLAESFGLGLIEAAICKCKIIASNLPYVFEIVKPSLTFDPLNANDIANKVIYAIKNDINKTEINIHNKINDLLSLLS